MARFFLRQIRHSYLGDNYRFHMARHCSRTGCTETATVTLTYQYANSLVWLDHLAPTREPHAYDLCGRHAGRITPPTGWRLEDRRRQLIAHTYGRLAG